MISKEEFIKQCDDLIPQEEKDLYTKKTKKMWSSLLIVLAIELLSILLIPPGKVYLYLIVGFVMLVSTIIIITTMRYKWSDFKGKYSKQALQFLLKGYDFSFEPTSCIGPAIFRASGFASNYDDYRGEDLLSISIPNDDGTPSNTTLNICDLYVTREETRTVTRRDSNGRTYTETEKYTVTVYRGVFGYIYFPFKFKCNMALNIHFKGQKKVKLEDIKFNRIFKTYTDNQLESLVILTPTLITKLIKYSNRVHNLKLSLTDSGAMYLGYSNNLFKLNNSFKKPSGQVFEHFYDDIIDILILIEEIKTNNKVFEM